MVFLSLLEATTLIISFKCNPVKQCLYLGHACTQLFWVDRNPFAIDHLRWCIMKPGVDYKADRSLLLCVWVEGRVERGQEQVIHHTRGVHTATGEAGRGASVPRGPLSITPFLFLKPTQSLTLSPTRLSEWILISSNVSPPVLGLRAGSR